MKADEFINICQVSGYASKRTALQYCEASGRDKFTEEDFSEVFRINEQRNFMKILGVRSIGPTGDGDYLINKLNKRPDPWNRIFDASRGNIDKL